MIHELVTVVDQIQKFCLDQNIDPSLLYPYLHCYGYLTVDEVDMINHCETSTQKHLKLFSLLKSKPDDIFLQLQQICFELKWIDIKNFIHLKLKEVGHERLIWESKGEHVDFVLQPSMIFKNDQQKNLNGENKLASFCAFVGNTVGAFITWKCPKCNERSYISEYGGNLVTGGICPKCGKNIHG